nr:Gag-Pol polyprotein [Tanacetum cinerariifolium]
MRVVSINGKRHVLVIVDDYSRCTWVHFPRTKDEIPEVIKNFLKKIYVRLQAPVIIVHSDNGTEFKNHVLKNILIVLASHMKLLLQKLLSKMELLNAEINDREDIGKLGAKGDIGFFIGYSANSVTYIVYNRRTRKIMKTMNVTFDELSAMAFEQNSSRPGLQKAPRAIPAAPVVENLQAPTASMSLQDSAPVPTNS